jgi:Cdc6-like AAA superfamily ATPase
MVGLLQTKSFLVDAISNSKQHHALLIYGAPGFGKTTLIKSICSSLLSLQLRDVFFLNVTNLSRHNGSDLIGRLFEKATSSKRMSSVVILDDLENLFWRCDQRQLIDRLISNFKSEFKNHK